MIPIIIKLLSISYLNRMESTNKQRNTRTPSQCREWERQRRNKFNDAISLLGEIVKALWKPNKPAAKETDTGKAGESVKYPKIEIVQKAIICLTNSTQEKTKLKAEILELQVQLDTIKQNAANRKDASTQVFMEINKKSKSDKYVKLMKKKSKHSGPKEKDPPTQTVITNSENKTELLIDEIKNRTIKKVKANAPISKMPILLPLCNIFDKKASENAIVVLPATPYLYPQRPFLLPPTIVVVDHNIQAVNKAVPILSRNGGDITKTTMVNILPISAYSRPLSATKQKKSNVRLKSDTKNAIKKSKIQVKNIKELQNNEASTEKKDTTQAKEKSKMTSLVNEINVKDKVTESIVTKIEPPKSSIVIQTPNEKETTYKDTSITKTKIEVANEASSKPKIALLPKTTESDNTLKSDIDTIITPKTVTAIATVATVDIKDSSKNRNNDINKTSNKIVLGKEIIPENKDKETKLPNILDTTLDNVVDGGNARLELAEEFLAASPTAAFLMSFPLVSGNRAESPAEEPQNNALSGTKDIAQKRNELLPQQSSTTATFFEKTDSDIKMKATKAVISTVANKQNVQPKYISSVPKLTEPKISTAVTACNVLNENPFLNLPMPSLIPSSCSLSDTTFGQDFESNLNKPASSQPGGYTSNGSIFYKNDPFSTVKSTIYSTSSISSNHDFNGIGLYPCAMEKYASKNKSDFTSLDENNVMKMGSSRLTYDIDLGWSHKSFDFVSCTSNTTFGKDSMTTVSSSTPFCTTYNPFNPEFHVPLVSTSNKKDNVPSKPSSSFADTLTSFYTQHNLWPEEPLYNNTNVSKSLPTKHQNYPLPTENVQAISNVKPNNPKHYEIKGNSETNDSRLKSSNNTMPHQINEKYTKKSPSKMHINWMTSEIRPMQTTYNPMHTEMKEPQKLTYNHLDHTSKRNDHSETNNYFPISMHNFPSQPVQEEFQVWPSARPLGTTEISIDPPPINLPTLVGDLALGPHDKKKSLDPTARTIPQQDLQNCSNFFSVTQLMNRSSENVPSRYQPTPVESSKPIVTKHNISHYSNESNRKAMASRIENHAHQPYIFNNPKLTHSYENMAQFTQNKPKTTNIKSDKNTKVQKNNYSAEALIRGGSFTQKVQDNSSKFLMPSQKYNEFNTAQESSVAQVSHFPPIIDYSENGYTGQQFSGTSLYNATTNTLSNSFYSNFMPGSSNLMSTNYTSGPFTGEFIDYNQPSECNFTNHKYEELKMRNNPPIFQADKMPSNYKSSRRESAAKHKLECSKKESSKKYQSKKAKLSSDVEEWSEPSHPLWQNKPPNKRHPNLMTEDLPFPNYVSNQMHSQYQPDFFNSHLMPSNMQAVGPNVDRSLSSIPITSRANFNLSTIFPEITMKVQ